MKQSHLNNVLCSIIIPVFNNWKLTKNCLESVREHTPEGIYEVIVVDNASTDATKEELAALGTALFGSHFTLLRFAENRNFGPACNAGAKKAQADMLFFLNNDTLVTPQWFGPLYEAFASNPKLGGVGPLLLYENDLVQHLGVTFYSTQSVGHLYQNMPRRHPAVTQKRRLQAITGAAFMIPQTLFWNLDGFYEEYRNGFEDVDLCLRLVQQKYALECITESVVYHLESQSTGRDDAMVENSLLLKKRCGQLFFIDWHHHALRDGFNAILDGFDSPCILVRDKESEALAKQVQKTSLQNVARVLKENIYWTAGFDLLADGFEQQNLFDKATHVRLAQCKMYITLANAKKLLRVAFASKQKELIDRAQALFYEVTMHQKHKTEQQSALYLHWKEHFKIQLMVAQNAGDVYLEQLYAKAFTTW